MRPYLTGHGAPPHAALSAALDRFALPALGVLGATLILLRETNYGVGLTWDSAYYIAAARNLLAGDGLNLWHEVPYYGAPPLFPLLLAAVGWFGIDVIAAAGYVNAAAFGLTVFVVAAWLRRRVRSPLLAVWGGCACALSPALTSAAAHAWTESVFILSTVVSLALLDRFLSNGKAPELVLAAAAAGASLLTRYVGLVLVGAGGLVLLLRTGVGFRIRVRDVALWSVGPLTLFGVWVARNLLILGSVLASQHPDGFSALLSLHRATGEFALWLFGPTGFDLLNRALGSVTGIDLAAVAAPAIVAKAVLLAAPVIGAGYALARYRPGFLRRRRTILTVSTVFVAAYAIFLAAYLPLTDVVLPVRYLWPLFPPLLVAATLALDECTNAHTRNAAVAKKLGKTGPVVLAVVLSLWLAQQVGAAWSTTRKWLNDGSGYTARAWVESDVIRYLNANRLAGDVWSSEPPALYFHTELRRVSMVSRSLDGFADWLARRAPGDSAYVVLFKSSLRFRNYGYGPDDVDMLQGIELVADLDDGVILRACTLAAADSRRGGPKPMACHTPAP